MAGGAPVADAGDTGARSFGRRPPLQGTKVSSPMYRRNATHGDLVPTSAGEIDRALIAP
jgi:hypothetical protein